MPDYFTLEELRALPDVDDEVAYPDTRVEAVAAAFVGVIEREVGTSFIGRTVTDEPHDGGTYGIVLKASHVRSVGSATENGVAVTATLLLDGGVVYKVTGTNNTPILWSSGRRNIKITYTAGYSATPPADVKEQALQGTRSHLLATAQDAGITGRRTSLNTDMGVVNFVVAGPDRPTGYPEVDAMIDGWKKRLDVHGFA